MKVKDCFTYNGEADILELRLNILQDVVDEFVIVEQPRTFKGDKKPLYFLEQIERFKPWLHKINYYVNAYSTREEQELARQSPNTGANPFWMEVFMAYEAMKRPLKGSADSDIIFISDVDEIWNPAIEIPKTHHKLEQVVYIRWLNNRSTEPWLGTIVTPYRFLRDNCLNHLKSPSNNNGIELKVLKNGGWHFTYQGGKEEVRRKLESNNLNYSHYGLYAHEIEQNLETNNDFFSRGFTYTIDESEWPQYLKDNKEKYKDLCLK